MNEILKSRIISLFFKDKLPSKYRQQCLTLLSRFEIAVPLDENNKIILIIPLLLSKSCLAIVYKLLQDGNVIMNGLLFFTLQSFINVKLLLVSGVVCCLIS